MKKKFGSNMFMIPIIVVLAAAAVWLVISSMNKAKTKFDQTLKETGNAVGIGKAGLEYKSDGMNVVGVDNIPGLKDLLNGTDVDAVVDALEKAGIKKVLVDPSIAKRDPLPSNTVINRLALARPSGRLTAKLMSQDLFHFEIGDAPLAFSTETKKALIAIARSAFTGSDMMSTEIPPEANKKGEWTMILTIRPLYSTHISYHSTTKDTLSAAAADLGQRAGKYYRRQVGLQKKYGTIEAALKDYLTVELEVAYDFGTFVGPKDNIFMWRIIEPGIYGMRMSANSMFIYQPPWYTMTSNLRTVESMFGQLCSKLKEKENCWKKDDATFDRFRTVHWRERSPGGELEDLYRAAPRVPTTLDVTKENLVASLKGLGDWIADNQTDPEGKYVYRYFPTKDEESTEYNMVRHCLGPFSMALTQEFVPDPKYREKAEAGMKFIESHIRWGGPPRNIDGSLDESSNEWMGKPLPGPDVAILEFQEPENREWSSKMGAVAVTILGYTQYKRVGWKLSKEHEKVLQGLAQFLLYMQDERDGKFHHYYAGKNSHYYGEKNSIFPGEILYAIARLYGETKDEKYRAAFKKSMSNDLQWFKDEMEKRLPDGTYEEEQRKNLVQFQPWIAMAMDEMYRYDQDPSYVEASNLVSLWIIDKYQFDETRAFFPDYLGGYMKVLDELPAMHTFVYTEGTAASFDLARRAGVESKILEKLRKGALLAARFVLQQQIRPDENDYYFPNPNKAKGGVKYCMNHTKQRIDYTYHALSSIYRILKAATPEDYAAVNSIPMPKTW